VQQFLDALPDVSEANVEFVGSEFKTTTKRWCERLSKDCISTRDKTEDLDCYTKFVRVIKALDGVLSIFGYVNAQGIDADGLSRKMDEQDHCFGLEPEVKVQWPRFLMKRRRASKIATVSNPMVFWSLAEDANSEWSQADSESIEAMVSDQQSFISERISKMCRLPTVAESKRAMKLFFVDHDGLEHRFKASALKVLLGDLEVLIVCTDLLDEARVALALLHKRQGLPSVLSGKVSQLAEALGVSTHSHARAIEGSFQCLVRVHAVAQRSHFARRCEQHQCRCGEHCSCGQLHVLQASCTCCLMFVPHAFPHR
jgi:hypothetical protein